MSEFTPQSADINIVERPDTVLLQDTLKEIKREALITSLEPGPKEVSSRRLIRDEHGVIRDVEFSQNGTSVCLRDVLPGLYDSIDFKPMPSGDSEPTGQFILGERKLTVESKAPESGDSLTNLILLHEAGHACDFQMNQKEYNQDIQDLTVHLICRGVLQFGHRKDEGGSQQIMGRIIDSISSLIQEEYGSPLDVELVRNTVEQKVASYSHIKNDVDSANLDADLEDEFLGTKAQMYVKQERRAWANALRTLRQLRKKGIQLYNGSTQELLAFIDKSLNSYQEEEGVYLPVGAKQFINPKKSPLLSQPENNPQNRLNEEVTT